MEPGRSRLAKLLMKIITPARFQRADSARRVGNVPPQSMRLFHAGVIAVSLQQRHDRFLWFAAGDVDLLVFVHEDVHLAAYAELGQVDTGLY